MSSAIVRSLESAGGLGLRVEARVGGFEVLRVLVAQDGFGVAAGSTACMARSAARCTSSSTFCSSRLMPSASRMPSRRSHICILAMGSRAVSAWTSSSLRYCRSSSESECE